MSITETMEILSRLDDFAQDLQDEADAYTQDATELVETAFYHDGLHLDAEEYAVSVTMVEAMETVLSLFEPAMDDVAKVLDQIDTIIQDYEDVVEALEDEIEELNRLVLSLEKEIRELS